MVCVLYLGLRDVVIKYVFALVAVARLIFPCVDKAFPVVVCVFVKGYKNMSALGGFAYEYPVYVIPCDVVGVFIGEVVNPGRGSGFRGFFIRGIKIPCVYISGSGQVVSFPFCIDAVV